MIERKPTDWTASDFIRQVSGELTGNSAFDAQDNLEFLRNYLNSRGKDVFTRATWANGVARFYSGKSRFVYDFQKRAAPSKEEFLAAFDRFSIGGQV